MINEKVTPDTAAEKTADAKSTTADAKAVKAEKNAETVSDKAHGDVQPGEVQPGNRGEHLPRPGRSS